MRNNEEKYESSWGVWNFTISFVFHYWSDKEQWRTGWKIQRCVELCHFLCLSLLVCQRTVKDNVKLQGCVKLCHFLHISLQVSENNDELCEYWGAFGTWVHSFFTCQWWSAEQRRTVWHLEPCHFLKLPLPVSRRTMWNCVSAEKWAELGSCWSDFCHFSTCAKLCPMKNGKELCECWKLCGTLVHFISFVIHRFSEPTELYLSSCVAMNGLTDLKLNGEYGYIYKNYFLLSSIAGHTSPAQSSVDAEGCRELWHVSSVFHWTVLLV